jgi:hypothetical protein
MSIGFADSGQCERIASLAAAFELDRVTEAGAIKVLERQSLGSKRALQPAAHPFENGRHQCDEAHWFAEHGNPLIVLVCEEPFDAVEQPARQTEVVDLLAVERERVGRRG